MPVIPRLTEPLFTTPNVSFTPLATPSRGDCQDVLVCNIDVTPGVRGATHQVTRQQVYVAQSGKAVAHVADQQHEIEAGQVFLLEPGLDFALEAVGDQPFTAVVCAAGDAEVVTANGRGTPPWAR